MNKKIAVLLSTYNGEKYIKEQLASLYGQNYKNFEIIARDDKSSDTTVEILKRYNLTLLEAEHNLGAKQSFAELLKYATSNSDAEYFMFCDQDDVWKNNKIEKTLIKMQELEQEFGDVALLVHTDLEVVDENLNLLCESMWSYEYILPQYNSLSRLIIQNTITGCTIMINKELAKKCLNIPNGAIMHDWWMGLLASYFGKIGYIQESTLQYRQHSSNTIGAQGFKLNVTRHILSLLKSLIFRDKTYLSKMQINREQAKAFLEMFDKELDDKTRKMLEEFVSLDQKTWWQKRRVLWKYKLLKQGFIRNLGMFLKL